MFGVLTFQLFMSFIMIAFCYRNELSILLSKRSASLPVESSRRKTLSAAKARVWAHWLFWLFTPFGSSISCAKLSRWSPLLAAVFINLLGLYLTAIAKLNVGSDMNRYWLLSVTWTNILGAIIMTIQIWAARKQLGIKAATDAEKMIAAEVSSI